MVLCQGCGFKLKPYNAEADSTQIQVKRYDRLESRYLTTGDFSALQSMNTDYPIETRTLIEKVLQIGVVTDPNISNKFLMFYQDSVLQSLLSDVESEYANIDDINQGLTDGFNRLAEDIPGLKRPEIYMQIGALDQSIIVGENSIGICLDKYMGEDYPLYQRYYLQKQLKSMDRNSIVPDCLSFYLLSLFPIKNFEARKPEERDLHVNKVMWVVNKAIKKNFFKSEYINIVDRFMKRNPKVTVNQLLENEEYDDLKKMK